MFPYRSVDKDTRNIVIGCAAVAALFIAGFAGMLLYSGMSPPFYTVESGSMRHSDDSKVGILDAGDMVIVRHPSKSNIATYMESSATGYVNFGDLGDVIIYERPGKAPIIHRAIVHLEYQGDRKDHKWYARGLDDYKGEWYCTSIGNQPENGKLSGLLTFKEFGFMKETIVIDLGALFSGQVYGEGGYVTMGDRNSPNTDQGSGITDGLVTNDMIIAVAAHEVPWLGCIKLLITSTNTDRIPGNSIILLIASIVLILGSAIGLSFLYETYRRDRSKRLRKDEVQDEEEKVPEADVTDPADEPDGSAVEDVEPAEKTEEPAVEPDGEQDIDIPEKGSTIWIRQDDDREQ
ncbi:MAG: S26 family signal peptidase [Methanomassiliicoccaceae archaeon]|jgi:signal peptidase|nr:S26 family signal peptidase [Methanomassiliicoccaceae archaeon]